MSYNIQEPTHHVITTTIYTRLVYVYDRSAHRLQLTHTIAYHRSVHLPIVHHPHEETAIIEGTYNYLPNRSESYYQPSYGENLELEEQMGRAGSRLSEKTIMGNLKIRSCDATSKRMDEEPDICVICQGEYEKDELIGGLHCRHEYHVNCVTKWLQQHNSCPICKAVAVSPNGYKF